MIRFRFFNWVALVLALAGTATASSGDRSYEFQSCVEACQGQRCPDAVLSPSLRMTRWTCTDDCKYACMHQITDRDIARGVQVQQYYGKWPFWRLLGMQEPASVAFSLLNLAAHVRGGRKIVSRIPDGHPMKNFYFTSVAISCAAWIFSAVFHTRDLPITEKMDYFCAAMTITYSLYCAVVRLFHLYPSPERYHLTSSPEKPHLKLAFKLWSVICAVVYLCHVTYLSLLPRFDYSYNIMFNLGLGLAHNFLWLTYSFPTSIPLLQRFRSRSKSYRPPYAHKAAVLVGLMMAALALELFDFPPWRRVLDAHSLWHLATAPITLLWYDFLIEDSLDDGWREYRA